MADEDPGAAPFNEQAALEELERLQRALEESRRRRKDASAAFDVFVGSFGRESASGTRNPKAPAPASGVEATPQYASRLAAAQDIPVELAPRSSAAHRSRVLTAAVAGGAIAIVAGVLLTRAWRGAPAKPPESATAGSGRSGVGIPVSTSSAAAQPTSGIAAELIALRRVWVRAIVDGERALERELEADARVPLRATRTIVIRAGDGGALRLTIDGRDQGVLGRDGLVVTRSFAVSSPTGR